MGSIMLNKNKIMDFDDNNKEYLIDYCSLIGVKYIVNNEDIVLFPRLFEKTLILKNITNNKEERELAESIKNILINEGATVISYESFMDRTSLKYIDAQIFVVISFEKIHQDLTIYVSSDANGANTLVAKQLLKQLILSKKVITYKIANIWNRLKKIKYWTYLFGNSTSTLILEISKSALSEDFLSNFDDILAKSIIEELGDNPPYKKVEEFICKLKSYKNNLNHYYTDDVEYTNEKESINTEAEEALEKVSNNIDNDVIEESENEKKEKNSNNKNSKAKIDVKKDKAKSEKVYLPNIPIDNVNQGGVNQQIRCPIVYPGESAVYVFQRPKVDNKNP